MTQQQLRLLNDSRLSDAARILGFYLSTLPEGPQEMKHDSLAVLLHGTPNADTVGRHLRQLVVHGYANKASGGGRGSPRYEWREVSTRENSRADDALPAKIHGQRPSVVVVGSSNPLNPPVELKPLATDASALIEAERETLGECVKPLGSYLRRRVTPDSQEPYVGRVLSALDPECMNPQWRDATGAVIPMPRRRAIMADALNELATADETKDRKWKSGDWGNLRNKLLGLIRAENAPPIRATGTNGARASPRDRPADTQDYKPSTHFEGFNG